MRPDPRPAARPARLSNALGSEKYRNNSNLSDIMAGRLRYPEWKGFASRQKNILPHRNKELSLWGTNSSIYAREYLMNTTHIVLIKVNNRYNSLKMTVAKKIAACPVKKPINAPPAGTRPDQPAVRYRRAAPDGASSRRPVDPLKIRYSPFLSGSQPDQAAPAVHGERAPQIPPGPAISNLFTSCIL